MERKTKTIIVITLCIAIVGLSVGYAALNSILNIAGNAKVGATAANWNISFKNVNCEAGGYAEAGSISSTGTTITISESKLKAPKDYVICIFDVVNDGTIDAEVTSVTVPDPSSFTYTIQSRTRAALPDDEELVKNGLVSEMKYNNTNKDEIKIGDKLDKGTSKAVYLKIEFLESVTRLPINDVAISDIFGQIVFGQSGSSGSEEGGSESLVYSVGDAVYYNPVSGQKCDDYVASNITEGCMKWYVINDGETVDMILDHNTTAKFAWNSSGNNAEGPVTANNQLASDVSGWGSEAKNSARLISADEIAGITGAASSLQWNSSKTFAGSVTDINTQVSYFVFDGSGNDYSGWQSPVANESNPSRYYWLYENTSGCVEYGCKTDNTSLYGDTYGYWTLSPLVGVSNGAWGVTRGGGLHFVYVGYVGSVGVRPVITISKFGLS